MRNNFSVDVGNKPRLSNMIPLPYQQNTFLCPESKTRWVYNKGEIYRDTDGENEWIKMGEYVGKTYEEIFAETFKYAMNAS